MRGLHGGLDGADLTHQSGVPTYNTQNHPPEPSEQPPLEALASRFLRTTFAEPPRRNAHAPRSMDCGGDLVTGNCQRMAHIAVIGGYSTAIRWIR